MPGYIKKEKPPLVKSCDQNVRLTAEIEKQFVCSAHSGQVLFFQL